jgi:hypothetical protein
MLADFFNSGHENLKNMSEEDIKKREAKVQQQKTKKV